MIRFLSKKLPIIVIVIVGLAMYLFGTKGIPGNIDSSSPLINGPFTGDKSAFELSHERSAYATVVALDETGRTDLSPELANMGAPDMGFYRDKYYSLVPPGLAVSSWPLYKLGQQFDHSLAAAYFMTAIFGVLGLIFLYKICDEIFRFPRWLSLFIAFSTGLASTYFNFSITFYQHVPSTFLLILGFYGIWRYGRYHNWLWAAVGWICYGLGPFFDYPNLITLSPLILYLLYQGVYLSKDQEKVKLGIRNSLVISALFLVLLGAAHMYYNQINYGDWSKLSNTLPRFDPRQTGLSEDELKAADIERIAEEKNKVSFALKEVSLANGFFVLLFDLDKSLLMHMPIFLLSIFGIYRMRKQINMEIIIVMLIIAGNILLYSSFFDPWGGWGFGPRYLIASMPFFNILVGLWLADGKIWKRLIALPLVLYGAGAAILGGVTKNFLVPKVEILPYDLPYKIWSEFKFLWVNQNGTLIYNEFLSSKITLAEYFIALWLFTALLFVVILFILPGIKYGNKTQ